MNESGQNLIIMTALLLLFEFTATTFGLPNLGVQGSSIHFNQIKSRKMNLYPSLNQMSPVFGRYRVPSVQYPYPQPRSKIMSHAIHEHQPDYQNKMDRDQFINQLESIFNREAAPKSSRAMDHTERLKSDHERMRLLEKFRKMVHGPRNPTMDHLPVPGTDIVNILYALILGKSKYLDESYYNDLLAVLDMVMQFQTLDVTRYHIKELHIKTELRQAMEFWYDKIASESLAHDVPSNLVDVDYHAVGQWTRAFVLWCYFANKGERLIVVKRTMFSMLRDLNDRAFYPVITEMLHYLGLQISHYKSQGQGKDAPIRFRVLCDFYIYFLTDLVLNNLGSLLATMTDHRLLMSAQIRNSLTAKPLYDSIVQGDVSLTWILTEENKAQLKWLVRDPIHSQSSFYAPVRITSLSGRVIPTTATMDTELASDWHHVHDWIAGDLYRSGGFY